MLQISFVQASLCGRTPCYETAFRTKMRSEISQITDAKTVGQSRLKKGEHEAESSSVERKVKDSVANLSILVYSTYALYNSFQARRNDQSIIGCLHVHSLFRWPECSRSRGKHAHSAF